MQLEKEGQTKPKVSQWKERNLKIGAEIDERETKKKPQQRSMKVKAGSLKR